MSLPWDSTTVANGSHTLAARARDGAGNTATSTAVTVTVANGDRGLPQVGQWGPLIPLPAVAIHSALLPNGRILLFQGDFAVGGQQYVFDPQTGAVTHVPDAAADLFCAGQAVLADGRVLVVGGTSTNGGLRRRRHHRVRLAERDLAAYSRRCTSRAGTRPGRRSPTARSWSPRATTKTPATSSPIPELYSPSTNSWQSLTAASHAMPIYPFIYQLPDGRIVHLGGSEEPTPSEVLDLSTNKWTTFDSRVIDGGSIANYAPGKFIKAGSAADDGFSGKLAENRLHAGHERRRRDLAADRRTWPSRAASSTSPTCPTAPCWRPAAGPTSPVSSTPTRCCRRRTGTRRPAPGPPTRR